MISSSGGVKYFQRNKSLVKDGAIGIATSGNAAVPHMLNPNPETFWQSVSSNDLTTETIEIVLPQSSLIDRLFLIGINWKEFTIQYKSGGGWVDFTNVTSIKNDVPGASISETDWDVDTAYFEFDEVTTQEIKITAIKTQVADQEKYCNQFVATFELGTFVGFPNIDGVDLDRNVKAKKTLTGKFVVQQSTEAMGIKFSFETYPTANEIYHADVDLVLDLQNSEESFLTWLCGGKYGSDYFNYTLPGYRLKDLKQTRIKTKIPVKYMNNTYVNPIDLKFSLVESIL